MAKKETKPPVDPTFAQSQRELAQAEKEYQRNVRITQARPVLYRAALIVWLLFDALLVGLLLYVVFGYLTVGQFSDRRSVAEVFTDIAGLHDASLQRSPDALVTTDALVMDGDDGKYDFYAEMENTNEEWYATFDYGFDVGDGVTTDLVSGFIFPGELRPLIGLNLEVEGGANRAELVVENVVWQRIDGHEIDDVALWIESRSDFELLSAEYGDKIELEEGEIVRSSFAVKNSTPYNYWSAPFWVILERGGSVAGVNQATIAGFEAGETRDVTVNWFGSVPPSAQTLRIYPVIDYFDEDVYMDQPSNGIERP